MTVGVWQCVLLLLLLYCTVTLVTGDTVEFTPSMAEKLTDFLNEGMSEFSCMEAAALTVGVVTTTPQNNEFHIALGLRDVEQNLPVDDNTLFGIGSTSKAMTAIVSNKVLSEKGLSWEEPIVSFYPSFKLPGEDRTRQVTFKDLYSHSTCVTRNDFWWASAPDTFNVTDMMSKLQLMGEECEFRSNFKYNNVMYVAGSHIIEELTDESWDSLVEKTIFGPLNMTQSKTSFSEAVKTGNTVLGYQPYQGQFLPLQSDCDKIIDFVAQAGSVHSTASDMNKYMRHIVENQGEEYADLFWEPVINTGVHLGTTEELIKPPFPVNSLVDNYTISWVLGDYNQTEVLMHGGDTFTTHTFITLSREKEYGIFVSSTGGLVARAANQLITWYIQDLLLGHEPWLNKTTLCTFPGPWRDTERMDYDDGDWSQYSVATSSQLDEYSGTYSNEIFGNLSISFDSNTGLYFQYNKINCTLRQSVKYKTQFRCHANAPYVVSDTSVTQLLRILNVEFHQKPNTNQFFLTSNMMESGDSIKFSSNGAPRNYVSKTVILLFLVVLLFIIE